MRSQAGLGNEKLSDALVFSFSIVGLEGPTYDFCPRQTSFVTALHPHIAKVRRLSQAEPVGETVKTVEFVSLVQATLEAGEKSFDAEPTLPIF